MSAAASFYLSTEKPEELFDTLVRIWFERRPAREVVLIDRKTETVGFTTFDLLPEEERKQILEFGAEIQQHVMQNLPSMIESLEKAWASSYDGEEEPAAPPPEPPAPLILKPWSCQIAHYYYDEQDRKDFAEAVEVIVEFAEDDVFYFREPTSSFVNDEPDENDILVELSRLMDFEPNMNDTRRHVIRKAP